MSPFSSPRRIKGKGGKDVFFLLFLSLRKEPLLWPDPNKVAIKKETLMSEARKTSFLPLLSRRRGRKSFRNLHRPPFLWSGTRKRSLAFCRGGSGKEQGERRRKTFGQAPQCPLLSLPPSPPAVGIVFSSLSPSFFFDFQMVSEKAGENSIGKFLA